MRWHRSARGDLRYLSWGSDHRSLVRYLDYLPGLRGAAERYVVGSGLTASGQERDIPREAAEAVHRLKEEAGASSGFMLYTGYYKESWFVGPVLSAGEVVFCKIYKHADHQTGEIRNGRRAAELATAARAFDVIPARALGSRSVSYPAVRKAHRTRQRTVTALGVDIARHAPPAPQVDWAAEASIALTSAEGILDSSRRQLETESARWADLPHQLTHGDLTTWNVMETADRPILIDYERIGHRPIGYDLVYALAHPHALRRRAVPLAPIEALFESVHKDKGMSRDLISAALGIVLLEALKDLVAYAGNPYLAPSVTRKAEAFMRSLDHSC